MARNNKTILVTGATGQQGGATLRALRERGFQVRALTRDPNNPKARDLVGQGTEVVRGNLDEPASLARALDGADGVYSVQAAVEQGPEAETRQGSALISAAKRSRITQFVYSSVAGADQNTGISFFESKLAIEKQLQNSGLKYTIFRPVFFMENWPRSRDKIEQGTLALPFKPETRLQMIAVDDIGNLAASAFEKPGHWQGRTVEIAGDELSMNQIAESFSRMSGREVRYQQVPWDQFEQEMGQPLAQLFRWLDDVGYHINISALRQEYPQLMGFERWLQSKWAKRQTA